MTKCKEKFRKLDVYGQRIELTYRGQNRYSTEFGASATIFTLIILLVFVGIRLLDV